MRSLLPYFQFVVGVFEVGDEIEFLAPDLLWEDGRPYLLIVACPLHSERPWIAFDCDD